MSTDPAMVAVEKIIGAFPALRGQMLHGMPTIIRDAYAETWAENERLLKQAEELRRLLSGARSLIVNEWPGWREWEDHINAIDAALKETT